MLAFWSPWPTSLLAAKVAHFWIAIDTALLLYPGMKKAVQTKGEGQQVLMERRERRNDSSPETVHLLTFEAI